MGEESQQIEVKKGGKYTYHSKSQNKDITVSVLSAGLGTDENGKVDKTKPEYKGMYKVKSGENVFWVSPTALKGKVSTDQQKQLVKKESIKSGEQYSFIPKKKDGQPAKAKFATIKDDGKGNPIFNDNNKVTVTTEKNPNGFAIDINRLKTTK